uniref:Polyphosphate kinase-2-related domain-containing protein n=1 Tax=Chryseobacterium endophyticum TaxID=1854762 RepID=A0AAU6WQF0_9FLAO
MNINFSDEFLVKGKFSIKKAATEYNGKLSKEEGEQLLMQEKEKLRELQERLYSDGSQSLLVVLQAMDAAGKDSMIEHVFGGVNPQGCNVTSFKTPSSREYSHDFLWRHYLALPQKGMIGIFNRSHYESVLVCKVHPEYNLTEKTWKSVKDFNEKFWENRYESIRNFEKHLAQNGTTVVKIFLNVSKDEQKKRLLDRINEQEKTGNSLPPIFRSAPFLTNIWNATKRPLMKPPKIMHPGTCFLQTINGLQESLRYRSLLMPLKKWT